MSTNRKQIHYPRVFFLFSLFCSVVLIILLSHSFLIERLYPVSSFAVSWSNRFIDSLSFFLKSQAFLIISCPRWQARSIQYSRWILLLTSWEHTHLFFHLFHSWMLTNRKQIHCFRVLLLCFVVLLVFHYSFYWSLNAHWAIPSRVFSRSNRLYPFPL